jgi:hypothetical protein
MAEAKKLHPNIRDPVPIANGELQPGVSHFEDAVPLFTLQDMCNAVDFVCDAFGNACGRCQTRAQFRMFRLASSSTQTPHWCCGCSACGYLLQPVSVRGSSSGLPGIRLTEVLAKRAAVYGTSGEATGSIPPRQ